MTIGVLRVRLRLPSRTLKEKRQIVKSVVERVRTRFNAAVAEVDDNDTRGMATIGVCVVSNEGAQAEAMLHTILDFITDERLDAEVCDVETELLTV